MPINAQQLRDYVIRPTLDQFNFWSPNAEKLLLGTCAQESAMGTYIHQITGPACGIFQMEPATHDDIVTNFLPANPQIKKQILDKWGSIDSRNLIINLAYAALFCRILYWRVHTALPDATDIRGLANYWKQYYNTPKGKGTPEQFIANYNKYVGGV